MLAADLLHQNAVRVPYLSLCYRKEFLGHLHASSLILVMERLIEGEDDSLWFNVHPCQAAFGNPMSVEQVGGTLDTAIVT